MHTYLWLYPAVAAAAQSRTGTCNLNTGAGIINCPFSSILKHFALHILDLSYQAHMNL